LARVHLFLSSNVVGKINANYCSFVHLILILLIHYFVKCRSRSLAVYDKEFMLSNACGATDDARLENGAQSKMQG